jgi:hypothetical protein
VRIVLPLHHFCCLSPTPLETTAKATWKEVSPYRAHRPPFTPSFQLHSLQLISMLLYSIKMCPKPPKDNMNSGD